MLASRPVIFPLCSASFFDCPQDTYYDERGLFDFYYDCDQKKGMHCVWGGGGGTGAAGGICQKEWCAKWGSCRKKRAQHEGSCCVMAAAECLARRTARRAGLPLLAPACWRQQGRA